MLRLDISFSISSMNTTNDYTSQLYIVNISLVHLRCYSFILFFAIMQVLFPPVYDCLLTKSSSDSIELTYLN